MMHSPGLKTFLFRSLQYHYVRIVTFFTKYYDGNVSILLHDIIAFIAYVFSFIAYVGAVSMHIAMNQLQRLSFSLI